MASSNALQNAFTVVLPLLAMSVTSTWVALHLTNFGQLVFNHQSSQCDDPCACQGCWAATLRRNPVLGNPPIFVGVDASFAEGCPRPCRRMGMACLRLCKLAPTTTHQRNGAAACIWPIFRGHGYQTTPSRLKVAMYGTARLSTSLGNEPIYLGPATCSCPTLLPCPRGPPQATFMDSRAVNYRARAVVEDLLNPCIIGGCVFELAGV